VRSIRYALPLWKRKEHYALAHDSVEVFVRAAFEAHPKRPRLHVAVNKFGSLMNWIAAGLSRIQARIDQVAGMLEVAEADVDEWFLIEIVGQKTDRDEDILVAATEPKRIVYLTELSTVAESIAQASLKEVYLFAFRLASSEVAEPRRAELLTKARERLATRLVHAYYQTPGLAAILEGLLPEGPAEYREDSS
jgi:hypothetical protein